MIDFRVMLVLALVGILTLAFSIQTVESKPTIGIMENKPFSHESGLSDNPYLSKLNCPKYTSANVALGSKSLFAFYYPWYRTHNFSGYWHHWNASGHKPDNIVNGRRDIAAKHYPLFDVYDSTNESLIKKHVEIAETANIDCFVVSWWGIGSLEDAALANITKVCKQTNFNFTIYYEYYGEYGNFNLRQTVKDIAYLLDNYASNSSWYKMDGRPVIYVYGRALEGLNPETYWNIGGKYAYWELKEDMRDPPRFGIFVIHPYENDTGYLESKSIALPSNDTYSLELGISDFRNDSKCGYSDVGFRIEIKNETSEWETLDDLIVNFNDGWFDLHYNISSYAGQTVSVRVESYAGDVEKWCSEWAAVDYLCIKNSEGEIINDYPYFDNGWKTVVNTLKEQGYNPYFILDFSDYANRVQDFAEYFLNFTDGIHTYAPIGYSMLNISRIYNEASTAAHSKNKTFVATVVPGYDDTEARSPGHIVNRQYGYYYSLLWSIAKLSLPDHYVITSFNEWHEGTEVEPSLEYGYQYINLTRIMSTTWTWAVDDDGPADFHTIQGAINAANSGDTIYVKIGTYYENLAVNKTLTLIGENKEITIIDSNNTNAAVYVTANNTTIMGFSIRNSKQCGIYLSKCKKGIISENYILKNRVGVFLKESSYNKIFHNSFVNNDLSAISDNSVNIWDDGYLYGGNFWSDYKGADFKSGPYQNETQSDGIGDTPYVIDDANKDRYPLVPYADLNGDREVNILDAINASNTFGARPQHSRWNCKVDLNKDCVINIIDMIIIAENFGKTYKQL